MYRVSDDLVGLESEDELQEWLESYFEFQGWTAVRESLLTGQT